MEAPSPKKPFRFGEFMLRVYDAYFPHDFDYHGDLDADHPPAQDKRENPPASASPGD